MRSRALWERSGCFQCVVGPGRGPRDADVRRERAGPGAELEPEPHRAAARAPRCGRSEGAFGVRRVCVSGRFGSGQGVFRALSAPDADLETLMSVANELDLVPSWNPSLIGPPLVRRAAGALRARSECVGCAFQGALGAFSIGFYSAENYPVILVKTKLPVELPTYF